MDYKKLYVVLSKAWLDVRDIQLITSCGRDKSSAIRDEIIENISNNGKKVPKSRKKIIPTSYLIDYLGLDMTFIKNMAMLKEV